MPRRPPPRARDTRAEDKRGGRINDSAAQLTACSGKEVRCDAIITVPLSGMIPLGEIEVNQVSQDAVSTGSLSMLARRLISCVRPNLSVMSPQVMMKRDSPPRYREPPLKRRRFSSTSPDRKISDYGSRWNDWPAPRGAMEEARCFVRDMYALNRPPELTGSVDEGFSVLIVPDKGGYML